MYIILTIYLNITEIIGDVVNFIADIIKYLERLLLF